MAKKTVSKNPEEVTVEGIFGEGGLLASRHPGYEFRASQLAMAEVVDAAFQKHQHAVIEAGTGTGKTLAYLIPAIRSGRRVVISTATKSLQEQLFNKDVPFLQKHFAPNPKAALMKGRNNFLCRQKVHQIEGQAVLRGIDEVDWFSQIKDWEKLTETGERVTVGTAATPVPLRLTDCGLPLPLSVIVTAATSGMSSASLRDPQAVGTSNMRARSTVLEASRPTRATTSNPAARRVRTWV